MVQPKPRLKFTVKDYMSMPGDKRYQLLDGEMIVAPSPVTRHQRILFSLSRAMHDFLSARQLGEVFVAPFDVVLSNHDVAQPDILFVSNARSAIITEANIQGAPDLVVEILSPGTAVYDQGYKQALYGRHGVREYWLVDPDAETVEVLMLGEQVLENFATYSGGQTLESQLLEGLSIPLAAVFQQVN
ncbi:MAG: Uma2 family endonuclease [Chloroflexi bacterium]|nr:Uma2 family endonuclease [Chloroflexota bacterium]